MWLNLPDNSASVRSAGYYTSEFGDFNYTQQ